MQDLSEYIQKRGYRIKKKLGQGSQGLVWLLENESHALCTCKIGPIGQLQAEALALTQIRHPAFPVIHEFGSLEGQGILIRQYWEGETLAVRLGQKSVRASEMLLWIEELGEALCALHDMVGIWLIRDLKPENLLIDVRGHLKILDMGCACPLSQAPMSIAGSKAYSAPEQFAVPQLVSESSDIYAWARIAHELLQHCKDYKGWRRRKLRRIIQNCLCGDNNRRPSSMRMILQMLNEMSIICTR